MARAGFFCVYPIPLYIRMESGINGEKSNPGPKGIYFERQEIPRSDFGLFHFKNLGGYRVLFVDPLAAFE